MANIKGYPNNRDEFVGCETLMKWLHGRTSGVFSTADASAVAAAQNKMAVTVSDGYGWITDADSNGIVWWVDTYKTTGQLLELAIDAADSTLSRIDRVVVSWDTTNYTEYPEVKVLKGTLSSNPSAPALTNNSVTRQISLARVRIPAGTTSMTPSLITDERLDASVCGLVTYDQTLDTSVMQAQLEALLEEYYEALEDAKGGEPYVLKSGDTMSGDLNMAGNTVTGLPDPVSEGDAIPLDYARKTYAPVSNNAGGHNAVYRGKNLGTSVTPEQWAAIKAGTFDDMFIGDYWTINGTKYLIAHFDYRKTLNGSHHIVIVPALTMYTHAMNDTAITTGGYYDSKMKKSGLNQALETVKADFGADHIMTYKIYLTNATENGAASAGSVYDSQIDLMSERMVFGASAFGNGGYNAGNDRGQLALFALDTTASVIGITYLLRDVASVTGFAAVHFDGYAVSWWAAAPSDVRPAFCIYQA